MNNIRYADDPIILANSQYGLQNLINAITKDRDVFDIRINEGKTKTILGQEGQQTRSSSKNTNAICQ